ncbi:MAG: hypothetical protein ACRD15_08360 [Vicinamibacterales bacterium]
MSSATSIDRVNADGVREADARERANARRRDPFKPWHFFVLASLLAATAAVVLVGQSRPEQLVIISLTIGAAGFAAAALFRTLAPLVSKDLPSLDTPLTGSLRAVLEREKFLVLRSIKELEFDRAMGKVSPKDFDEMAARLRSRAMSLMRQLDSDAGYRELIEKELSARMRHPLRKGDPSTGSGSSRAPSTDEKRRPDSDPRSASEQRTAKSDQRSCVCGTLNDQDAMFCKRCGTKLGESTAS